MGLLDGIDVVRSSDPALRRRACDVSDFFVDVSYEGEIVRARVQDGVLRLHEGGDSFSPFRRPLAPRSRSVLREILGFAGCSR